MTVRFTYSTSDSSSFLSRRLAAMGGDQRYSTNHGSNCRRMPCPFSHAGGDSTAIQAVRDFSKGAAPRDPNALNDWGNRLEEVGLRLP